jgi:hypothetical protein
MENPSYYLPRAIEAIQTAEAARISKHDYGNNDKQASLMDETLHHHIDIAIRLLTLAKYYES